MNEKTINNLSKLYPLYYEYNNIKQHFDLLQNKKSFNVNDYLKNMYNLVYTQFGNMKEIYNNITYYQYHQCPRIDDIIDFINKIDVNINQPKLWLNEIKNNNVDKYLNSDTHYILISPFIYNPNFINYLNNYDYKDINIKDFLNKSDLIKKI